MYDDEIYDASDDYDLYAGASWSPWEDSEWEDDAYDMDY